MVSWLTDEAKETHDRPEHLDDENFDEQLRVCCIC